MSSDISWDDRTVKLRTTNLTHAIEIKASAPKGTFLGLTPPFEEGHKPNLLAQSHVARLEVKVSKRVGLLGLGGWETVCEEVFEPATLEFAGDSYRAEGRGKGKEELLGARATGGEEDYLALLS
ncbi:hypothetical protein BDV98DRAFT_569936 [Pterulicium gracile]|uniref:Uncharacterized protein n=1 Tax=Pterulicium gracile TaxID=1884261 RepID=A0A5C3QDB9_9AGAR|nr:hypothetical protein BDV98DRAFT_569936 [Pterula gracilis]